MAMFKQEAEVKILIIPVHIQVAYRMLRSGFLPDTEGRIHIQVAYRMLRSGFLPDTEGRLQVAETRETRVRVP